MPLEYWLLERDGQARTFFFAMMLCVMIWIMTLKYTSFYSSSRAASVSVTQESEKEPAPKDINNTRVSIIAQANRVDLIPGTDGTPLMGKICSSQSPPHRYSTGHLAIPCCHRLCRAH
jgi:hypothetical protein